MLLAIIASTLLSLGLYFMKRQAERLPSLGGGWRLGGWIAFFRDPLWLLGVLLQVAGYALYLSTLRTAQLSVVHTALNGGIALFVLFAVVGLGEEPRPLEWLGVAAVAVGLIALGMSGASTSPPGTTGLVNSALFSVIAIAVAAAALAFDRRPGRSIGLSVASGIMLGLAGMYAKEMVSSDSWEGAVLSWPFAQTLGANVIGFALMQGALQSGKGVVVMPIFSTLSNLVPIVAGILVYGESLSAAGDHGGLRLVSILLALGGAALLGAAAEK